MEAVGTKQSASNVLGRFIVLVLCQVLAQAAGNTGIVALLSSSVQSIVQFVL